MRVEGGTITGNGSVLEATMPLLHPQAADQLTSTEPKYDLALTVEKASGFPPVTLGS